MVVRWYATVPYWNHFACRAREIIPGFLYLDCDLFPARRLTAKPDYGEVTAENLDAVEAGEGRRRALLGSAQRRRYRVSPKSGVQAKMALSFQKC